ncbi:hypothetical protein ACJJTC_001679 [Scirpophaga incertulas]
MNDPWDVKSVRQAGQYVSCMKINGVPLLPPVLSKECREEMLYYKLLAKEVEKRISHLQPYVDDSESESNEDKTDAPELPENEQNYELPQEALERGCNLNIDKVTTVTNQILTEKYPTSPNTLSNLSVSNCITTSTLNNKPKKYVIDLSLHINETRKNVIENKNTISKPTSTIELPERDYNCAQITNQKALTANVNSSNNSHKTKDKIGDINLSPNTDKEILSYPFPDLTISQDGPSSLSSKSFTGSLIDIYTETLKESQIAPKLIRQRSYTLLNPSPHLLAHLEVQSLNTGVEMSAISMSDSFSHLNSPSKKRRSWDLETAKVKWSSMALELNKKNISNAPKVNGLTKNNTIKSKVQAVSPPRSKSVLQEKQCRSTPSKVLQKSDSVTKPNIKSLSPVRNNPLGLIITKQSLLPKTVTPKKQNDALPSGPQSTVESEDPAMCVRQLYQKIQKQQLLQMATLVEKQKREQQLLQQLFDEQNNLLYKQLKSICPKSPIEVKDARDDKKNNTISGPVSLSQLINHKPLQSSEPESPITDTLIQTNSYLNHCDDVLKRSKNITNSIKKQPNESNTNSPKPKVTGSKNSSKNYQVSNISRRLNYDTTTSSEYEYEPLLTDRTNDTMADLNVTFQTDQSNDNSFNMNETVVNQFDGKDTTIVHETQTISMAVSSTPDINAEQVIDISQNKPTAMLQVKPTFSSNPTPQEREAATRIVACARGYLVRRLLRTARVRCTVQTIRDALLCALQLHCDRAGIRGADVDLHRRLIQQITAACYSLHSMDMMSQSHSGVFPSRHEPPRSAMTQSSYGNTKACLRCASL